MAESLLRVRWYEALQFSLGSLMFQMSRAGPLASKSVRGVIGHQLNLQKCNCEKSDKLRYFPATLAAPDFGLNGWRQVRCVRMRAVFLSLAAAIVVFIGMLLLTIHS